MIDPDSCIVKIDVREKSLILLLQDLIPFCTEALIVGDITFTSNNKTCLIIERKTMSDFYSSIVDGRYREQKNRLKMLPKDVKICYLIEDFGSSGKLAFTETAKVNVLSGAMENLILTHNMFILPSFNISHTAKYVVNIHKKICSGAFTNFNFDSVTSADATKEINTYVSTPKKKGEHAMSNIFKAQLMLIKGLTSSTADKIVEIYPTVFKLIQKYQSLSGKDEYISVLSEIQLSKKKLGKALSERIYKVYMGLG